MRQAAPGGRQEEEEERRRGRPTHLFRLRAEQSDASSSRGGEGSLVVTCGEARRSSDHDFPLSYLAHRSLLKQSDCGGGNMGN